MKKSTFMMGAVFGLALAAGTVALKADPVDDTLEIDGKPMITRAAAP